MSTTGRQPALALTDAEKERIKLGANYLNSIAVAVFAIGGLAPLLSSIYGSAPASQSPLFVSSVATGCVLLSGVLHLAARRVLKGLSP